MIEPFKPNPRKAARARAMGEILKLSEKQSDELLAKHVREIAARVRAEEAAWIESLPESVKASRAKSG